MKILKSVVHCVIILLILFKKENVMLFRNILIALYLISTHFSLSHVHHDMHEHADCKVCHILQNMDSGDVDAIVDLVVTDAGYLCIFYPENYILISLEKGYCSQAPPLHLS